MKKVNPENISDYQEERWSEGQDVTRRYLYRTVGIICKSSTNRFRTFSNDLSAPEMSDRFRLA